MVLRSVGRSTNFQTPISVSLLNSSWEAASHLSWSSKLIASQYELRTSWNMLARIVLMFSPEGWGWRAIHSFVGIRIIRELVGELELEWVSDLGPKLLWKATGKGSALFCSGDTVSDHSWQWQNFEVPNTRQPFRLDLAPVCFLERGFDYPF